MYIFMQFSQKLLADFSSDQRQVESEMSLGRIIPGPLGLLLLLLLCGCTSEQKAGSRLSASNQFYLAAVTALAEGAIEEAEVQYRLALDADSRNFRARTGLVEILRVQGRNRAIYEHLVVLVNLRQCPPEALFAVAWPEKLWVDASDSALVRKLSFHPLFGRVQLTDSRSSVESSHRNEQNLSDLVEQKSLGGNTEGDVHGLLGVALVNAGLWDSIPRWNANLPDSAKHDPDVWYARGLWCLQRQDLLGSIRCFAQSVECAPDHIGALYQLMVLLPRTEYDELAPAITLHHQQLLKLKALVVDSEAEGRFPSSERIREISQHLELMGRYPEALGWLRLLEANSRDMTSVAEKAAELAAKVDAGMRVPEFDGALERLQEIHVPQFSGGLLEQRMPELINSMSRIQFRDDASETGLNFQFAGERLPTGPRMYEISGGGVAVVDLDSDEWPDLWFSQGVAPRRKSIGREADDVLYRNIRGIHFVRIEKNADARDDEFGQGPAVGDVNGDGFHDVFVCNIGRNQLCLNNGDGTFTCTDINPLVSTAKWSMSASIADLNLDSLPEVYVVNYLAGDAMTRSCENNGHPVQCRPTLFPGEFDELLLNQGDGRFYAANPDLIRGDEAGKGMGIVAGGLIPGRGNTVFVANDTTPNRLIQFESDGDSKSIASQSLFRGVEFGDEGVPLAGMGIASGDVNRDGLLDLFVTNFAGQPNSLFLQHGGGYFQDETRSLVLREVSIQSMGWGTQFLDADLDGNLDLFVANGHLEDYSGFGISSSMTAQVFRNNNSESFSIVEDSEAGPYFSRKTYGRAVARLDWNRDQQDDICVTHVGSPAALLTNLSDAFGAGVSLKLIGVRSERCATGAIVEVISSGKSEKYFATSGSGFQASNEHRIVISLPRDATHFSIIVYWPGGEIQRLEKVPVHGCIAIREDWPAALAIPD
jgi:tetratricopeptide (TPR) repeat protein